MDMYKKEEKYSQPKRQSKAIRIVSSIIVSFSLLCWWWWWMKLDLRSHWSPHSTPAKPSITTDIQEFSWSSVRVIEPVD